MKLEFKNEDIQITIEGRVKERDILAIYEIVSNHDIKKAFKETYTPELREELNNFEGGMLQQIEASPRKGAIVKMDCPNCGFDGKTTTWYGNTYTKCPECQKPLFNTWADPQKPHELDEHGIVYYANTIYKPKDGER